MKIACLISLALTAWIQAAGLEFKELLKEVHAPADAKTVTVEFEFTNTSDKPVTVAKYEPTCSCISVMIKEGKLRYAPGESGLIRGEFDMGNFSGTVDKVVALWIEGDPSEKPSYSLTVRVHIPVLVTCEPKTVKWDIGGKAEPQTIRVTMNHTRPIHLTSVTSSSEAYKYELKTVEDGKSYEVIVSPLNLNAPSLAVLRLTTDCDVAKHKTQQVFAVVRKAGPAEAAAKP